MNINPSVTTIHDAVVQNPRTGIIFQRYGLDLCSGDAKTIQKACASVGVDSSRLFDDLRELLTLSVCDDSDAETWDVDVLTDHIAQNHHRYVRFALPSILHCALKVARTHGWLNPDLIEIAKVITLIADDFEPHLEQEERTLFPYIKALVKADRNEGPWPIAPFGTIDGLLRAMDAEHERAEEWMAEIRVLTNNYVPPPEACLTWRVLYRELEEFEENLERHIYLEDEVLFPKAIAIEARSQLNILTTD